MTIKMLVYQVCFVKQLMSQWPAFVYHRCRKYTSLFRNVVRIVIQRQTQIDRLRGV